MFTKQVSIFLENEKGRLAEVTKLLADEGINIRAMALADTVEFGVLRLIVDDREQFLATRSADTFAGYPDPDATIGEVLRGDAPARPGLGSEPAGRILVSHLGVGLADVVFASAILARAEQLGLGRILPR